MLQHRFLNGFIEMLNSYERVIHTPFLTLYNGYWFTDIREQLEKEIHENFMNADQDKLIYLDYAKTRIEKEIIYKETNQFLEKWIEQFKLSDLEFPFIEDEQIIIYLATSRQQPNVPYEERNIIINMQKDFYCHAALLEKNNILKFIEKLFAEANYDKNPYQQIFTSTKAYNAFKILLEEFGNGKTNLANYSFVYHRMKRDGLIYDDCPKVKFIFLLLDFGINIDRIKDMEDIGNRDGKAAIYSKKN